MYNMRRRSELLDSLDYLIPPVKKLSRDFLYSDVKLTNGERLLKDCHRTVFGNPFWSKTSESDVQTCSSLILKKNTKQLIHEQYSIFNLSTCNHGPDLFNQNKTKQRKGEIPIIKVTVIPKAKETQTSTVFNKRCRYSKKIQSIISNQENSIKYQHFYRLTEGQKREKIHELKISESAKLSNRNIRNISHEYGDISFEQITESKQIINSLNMDKRKSKDKKIKKSMRTHVSNDRESPIERYGDNFLNPNDRKTRVTVVGQIGLTQDDRYVLKCAAAVNNKPTETNFTEDDGNKSCLIKNYKYHHSSPCRPSGCNRFNCETFKQFRQEDSNVQTDIDNTYYLPGIMPKNKGASQSTQVNFNFPNPQSIKKYRNQTAQCNCNHEKTSLDTDAKNKVLKECKSPLVIISVYQRQEKGTDKNDSVKIIQRHTSPERKEVTNINRMNITQENFKQLSPGKLYATNKTEPKLVKSRSPSPNTKIGSKKKIEYNTDSRKKNNSSVKKSGLYKTRSHKSYIIDSLEDHNNCDCHDSTFLQTEHFNRQQIKKSKDTDEVKKALVNSFLRNVNVMDKAKRKSKVFQPKDDASKITINIDGENDRYNVLLERSQYDTGVSIKKTTKAQPYQNSSSEEEVNTKSLENFLLVPNEKKNNEHNKQETEGTQPEPDVLRVDPRASRLNIKDSIEIFRRQGEHSNYHLKPHLKNDKNNFAETVFNSNSYAPVKHYQGDNCSLLDPNERDREIRGLLGIMRCHRIQNTDNTDGPTTNVRCCCRKKCSTGLMTGLSVSKLFTCKCLKGKNKRETKHEATPIEKPEVKDRIEENTDTNHEEKQKTTSSEQTRQESSKEHPVHRESDNPTHVKFISKKEKSLSKTIPKKEATGKERHIRTVHMNDSIMPMNLIVNRNIQLYLQIEQFSKARPVVLTRKQYDKVKRIIECRISKKLSIEKRKRFNFNNSNVVSIGEIKVKPKLPPPLRFNREIQTDRSDNKKKANGGITDKYIVMATRAHDITHITNKKMDKQIPTDVLVSERHNIEQVLPRQTVSSMEIRYAKVEYKKRVIISSSSTRFENDVIHSLDTNYAERNSNSIHTIFKGHKRSATPNLGTSAYSLYSNLTDFSQKSYKQPQCAGDFKPKKPFLQRLMSCLIMRSTQTSNMKDAAHKRKLPSVNNSLDSYHISTSLGALEMTSSLYDTSASFYSNHTTMPVNKIKRGFFSSVRGFLTSRRP